MASCRSVCRIGGTAQESLIPGGVRPISLDGGYWAWQSAGVQRLIPLAIAVVGLAVRVWVSTLGYTQDLVYEQHHIDLYRQSGFAGLMQWNLIHYGPVQPALILLLSALPWSLGTSMMLVCAASDGAIALMLWRRVSGMAAVLFWLCPVCIVVGAFQRVPETLALALGLAAVLVLDRVQWMHTDYHLRYTLLAALLLGLSLSTKYDLLLLPLWLAVRKDA